MISQRIDELIPSNYRWCHTCNQHTRLQQRHLNMQLCVYVGCGCDLLRMCEFFPDTLVAERILATLTETRLIQP